MPFNPQAIYKETLEWHLKLALNPGWKEYIWHSIQQINNDPSGLFKGIKEEFLKQINEQKLQQSNSSNPK
jgi:hypothetical protein